MTEQTTPPADDSLSYVESPAPPAPRKSQPLLLVLAALGLGVAGTLAWSEQANIVAAISGQPETGSCSMSTGGCCPLSQNTAVVLASQSEEGSCCSMKGRATAVAATETEAPVSALVPANSTTAVEAVTTL